MCPFYLSLHHSHSSRPARASGIHKANKKAKRKRCTTLTFSTTAAAKAPPPPENITETIRRTVAAMKSAKRAAEAEAEAFGNCVSIKDRAIMAMASPASASLLSESASSSSSSSDDDDDSPTPKKRACEENYASPPSSNKKTKGADIDIDAADDLPPDDDGIISDDDVEIDVDVEQSGKGKGGAVGVMEPCSTDCLLSRDFMGDPHPGNIKYRKLLKSKRASYQEASKTAKPLVAMDIVSEWKSRGGRFLKQAEKTGVWYHAGDGMISMKTCQALCLCVESSEQQGSGEDDDESTEWPLDDINGTDRTDNDVLLGATCFNFLAGNVKYQALLESKKSLYQSTKRKFKPSVAMDVVREWRSQDPPGRFLKRNDSDRNFSDIGDEAARKKICQELGKGSHQKERGSNENETNGTAISFSVSDAGYEAARKKLCQESGVGSQKQPRGRNETNGTAISFSDEDHQNIAGINVATGDLMPEDRRRSRRDSRAAAAEQSASEDTECVKSSALKGVNKGMLEKKKNKSGQQSITASPQKKRKRSTHEQENVRPYQKCSKFNDILSFFASTPFDAESMISLHLYKECKIQRTTTNLPPRASLPIMSQKEFMNSKAPPAPDNNNVHAPESPKHEHVDREVSIFLQREAKNLVNRPVSAQKKKKKKRSRATTKAASIRETVPQCSAEKSKSNDSAKALKHPHTSAAPVSNHVSLSDDAHTIGNGLDGSQAIRNTSLQENSTNGVSNCSSPSDTIACQTQVNNPQAAAEIAMDGKESNSPAFKVETAARMHGTPEQDKATMPNGTGLHVSEGTMDDSFICNSPKQTKVAATLISTEAARGLPTGWILKKFLRGSGKTANRADRYMYSPEKKIKFRSMKGCKLFIEILSEPGVDGRESEALKVFKERSHAF